MRGRRMTRHNMTHRMLGMQSLFQGGPTNKHHGTVVKGVVANLEMGGVTSR